MDIVKRWESTNEELIKALHSFEDPALNAFLLNAFLLNAFLDGEVGIAGGDSSF